MLKCTDCHKEYKDHNQLIPFRNTETDEYYHICRDCLASKDKKGKINSESYERFRKSLRMVFPEKEGQTKSINGVNKG